MKATCGFAVGAPNALPAAHHQACDDVVAHRYVAYVRPHCLDDSSPFVTEDHGAAATERAVEVVIVAVAQTGGHRSHKHFATDRRAVLDIGDREFVRVVEQDSSAHRSMVGDRPRIPNSERVFGTLE